MPYGGLKFLLMFLSFMGFAFGLSAQSVELVQTIENAQISRVANAKVCFATLSIKSQKGIDSFFATYETKNGDRWQVAGYIGRKAPEKDDVLQISFDGDPYMIRQLQIIDDTFFLPFTEEHDLQGFDEKIAKSNQVSLNLIRLEDHFEINLSTLRAAKGALSLCLDEID